MFRLLKGKFLTTGSGGLLSDSLDLENWGVNDGQDRAVQDEGSAMSDEG
jgi:hypothetical protein